MAVKSIGVLNNLTADTERGPSPSIWNANGSVNGWWADFIQDPRLGLAFPEDFLTAGLSPATGSAASFVADRGWYAYLDTDGLITDSGIPGGGINLAASTTAHRGVALGTLTNPFLIYDGTTLQGRLYFECRVRLSTASLAASTADVFIGLMDASGLPASAVPITGTGGSLATAAGFIGFHKRGGSTNPGDFNFVYNVAGGTPVYATNLQNIINTVTGTAAAGATWYKLGFVYNPFAESVLITSASNGQTAGVLAVPMIQVYVNGMPAAAFLTKTNVTGATFPETIMGPAIAFKQQSTTASVNCDVDWLYVAQQLIA